MTGGFISAEEAEFGDSEKRGYTPAGQQEEPDAPPPGAGAVSPKPAADAD